MSQPQSSNPSRHLRSASSSSSRDPGLEATQLNQILSKLSVLDTIAEDVASIKLAQVDLSKQMSACLESIEAHSNILSQHTTMLEKHHTEIELLKDSNHSLNDDITNLKLKFDCMDVGEMRNSLELLDVELKNWRAKTAAEVGTPPKVNAIDSGEVLERVRRANNILIRGLPETNGDDTDRSIILDVVGRLDVTAVSEVSAVGRVGVVKDGYPRPIKVGFRDSSHPRRILRDKKLLSQHPDYKSLIITDDKTPQQYRELQAARMELKAKRLAGETDLTIKYIKGIPTIVAVNTANTREQKN